jgi:glycosyltransferase 2 family protein
LATTQEETRLQDAEGPEESPPARTAWTRVRWPLKALVSGVLIVWVISRADLAEVAATLARADPRFVGAALCLNFVGWTISVTRWRILLKSQAVDVSFFRMLPAYLSAIFFNNFLPSTVGGDSLRAMDSWRWGCGKAGAVAVIGVDRLLGVLALFLFALVAVFLAPQAIDRLPMLPVWIISGAVVVVGVAALALLPSPRVRARLEGWLSWLPRPLEAAALHLSEALATFREEEGILRLAMGLSVALQLTVILHFFMIAQALSLNLTFLSLFLIIPVALVLMAIPISVNAIGIRENVFVFFLGLFGVSLANALAFAWIAFALVLFQGVVGGVVYAMRRRA